MPKGVKGPAHYKWRNGIGRHASGYLKVRIGKSHPISDQNGWAYLHQLVWWSAGRVVPAGMILHHVNEDKSDNRIENLEVVTRAEHNRHHNREKLIDPITGRFIGKRAVVRLLDGREWNEGYSDLSVGVR